MKVKLNYLIISSDNRDLDPVYNTTNFVSVSAFINKMYAKKYDYTFKFFKPYLDDDLFYNCKSLKGNLRHPSWSKLLSCIMSHKLYPEFDYIVWIDSDCAFNNFNLSILEYLEKQQQNTISDVNPFNANFIFLTDQPWYSKEANCGFFIFKNNEESIEILKDWYSYENVENNNYHDKGHAWEQVAFGENYHKKYFNRISLINDIFCIEINDYQFLKHYTSGFTSEERVKKLKVISDKIESNFENIINNIILETIKFDSDNFMKEIFDITKIS